MRLGMDEVDGVGGVGRLEVTVLGPSRSFCEMYSKTDAAGRIVSSRIDPR
jgi:hypothetical protein